MNGWWVFKKVPLFWAFVASLLFEHPIEAPPVNPNLPGGLTGWDTDSLERLVAEGRSQLDRQYSRFSHVTDRAQVLLGINLAVLAFAASTVRDVANDTGWPGLLVNAGWAIGTTTTLASTLGAGALIVVRADFTDVDTTQLSNMTVPLLPSLAAEYASAVIEGENTVAARVRMLRTTTRVLLIGASLVALSRAGAAF